MELLATLLQSGMSAVMASLTVAFVAVGLIAIHLGRSWWRLRHIPGPFFASLTDLQRLSWVCSKKAHLILQDAHEKYGELVRIGPNMVSFSNPLAIPTVYPMRAGFPKSEFYVTQRPYTRSDGALKAIFNTTDEISLKQLKNPIAPIFSMSSATSFEYLVDEVLQCFHEKLERRFASTGEIIDIGQWLQFFAFDVMSTMTFSKRYGFLDDEADSGGAIEMVAKFMRDVAPFTQAPFLDRVLRKNYIADIIWRVVRPTSSLAILNFVAQAIEEKRNKPTQTGDRSPGNKADFLTRYLELQKNNPAIPQWAPTAWTFSNVIAGSDSASSVMRTVVYNLLSYRHTLDKLDLELQSAMLTRPFPKYSEVRDLPYLDACVQEAARFHPPFALPLERIVPEGGIMLLGKHLPAGTIVGGNPYVVNRHRGTFGQDAEFWRPERWLESSATCRKELDQGLLTFGAGRRVCLGKHIGIMEIKKVIPFLVLNYNMRIVDREKFEIENAWFMFQRGIFAQFEKRPSASDGDTSSV